ncbi:MAG: cobalamin [Frankiales bacterium]|nr:cobalamin [Frankiales bacterium]
MIPLLLAVHGSRDPASARMTERIAAAVRAALGADVSIGYVDNSPPSLAEAFAALAATGVTDLVVVPTLLIAASHSKGDVPGSIQAAHLAHPSLRIAYGRPLWPDPRIVEAVDDRLREAGIGAGDSVVIASAGAADPDANAELCKVARLLWEGRSYDEVVPAYASATTPTPAQAVHRLLVLGASRVAVVPFFLSPGNFQIAVDEESRAAGAAVITDVLGDHPGIVSLVADRYREALTGDIRMNCDLCQYRVPFPGRETRVGSAQRPHAHPHDAPRA